MDPTKAPPHIFDNRLLKLRRARAAQRPQSFLLERCLDDLADRLTDVNRAFSRVLIVGDNISAQDLTSRLPQKKIKKLEICSSIEDIPSSADFDLVISLLRLQSGNDLPGSVIQMRQRLKPDGLFIGAMFGGDTLTELRQGFYKVDEEQLGGLAPHIFPMASYSQVAGLLSRAGLNQPVVDTDRMTVAYQELKRLVEDLRDLGETNVLLSMSKSVLTKPYWQALKAAYTETRTRKDGKLLCSFEILWMTGWAPHDSQQKPLRPGSAKMSLKDALKNLPKPKS